MAGPPRRWSLRRRAPPPPPPPASSSSSSRGGPPPPKPGASSYPEGADLRRLCGLVPNFFSMQRKLRDQLDARMEQLYTVQ